MIIPQTGQLPNYPSLLSIFHLPFIVIPDAVDALQRHTEHFISPGELRERQG
jgi:hypothetical protein